jgi:hypothetical protein
VVDLTSDSDWIKLMAFPSLDEAESEAEKLDGTIPSESLGPLDEPVTADHAGVCYL